MNNRRGLDSNFGEFIVINNTEMIFGGFRDYLIGHFNAVPK